MAEQRTHNSLVLGSTPRGPIVSQGAKNMNDENSENVQLSFMIATAFSSICSFLLFLFIIYKLVQGLFDPFLEDKWLFYALAIDYVVFNTLT